MGLLPEGKYPQEIIDDGDSSWMQDDDDDDDEDEEDDFLPNDIKNGEKIDRPKDLMDSPFLFNFPNPF